MHVANNIISANCRNCDLAVMRFVCDATLRHVSDNDADDGEIIISKLKV